MDLMIFFLYNKTENGFKLFTEYIIKIRNAITDCKRNFDIFTECV
jgi:hypothetical protein